jgi:hypothetical protein
MPILCSLRRNFRGSRNFKISKILQQNRKTYRWAIRRFNEKSIATFKSITADDEYSSTILNNPRYNKLQLMRDLSFNYQYTI